LGDLNLNLEFTAVAIGFYKKAVDLNGNLSAINKLRNIFSSDDKYIEEVLSYYPKIIKKEISKIFLVKDLFYIYKNLNKDLSVYNMASIIYSLKLGNEDAENIYKSLRTIFPEKYNVYDNSSFVFLKSTDDNLLLRELFYIGMGGINRLSKKTTSDFKNIEKITPKTSVKIWNTFSSIKEKLDFESIDLYLNKDTSIETFDFIYPDNLALIIPSSMLNMDQAQLSYFISVQLDRIKSMNFLLNYHSIESLIKFMKIIINYTSEQKIFDDSTLDDYYKLFSKGISRTTKKKLYSLKNMLVSINWKDFDLVKFITSSYKTSLNIGLIISEDINILVRALLKTKNLNNLTMSSDELLEELSNIPELEEVLKFLVEDKYIALLNSLNVKIINKSN
jgi:hypothetical protein